MCISHRVVKILQLFLDYRYTGPYYISSDVCPAFMQSWLLLIQIIEKITRIYKTEIWTYQQTDHFNFKQYLTLRKGDTIMMKSMMKMEKLHSLNAIRFANNGSYSLCLFIEDRKYDRNNALARIGLSTHGHLRT